MTLANLTGTDAQEIADDFWSWFGAKHEATDALVATMPARDEESRTVLGAEMLDIEFEPISQA